MYRWRRQPDEPTLWRIRQGMKRSEQRESIFRLLYMRQFNSGEEMADQLAIYMQRFRNDGAGDPYDEPEDSAGQDPDRQPVRLNVEDESYISEKFRRVADLLPEIDEILNKVSSGWKTTRMSKVDLSILRLAVYEMQYDETIPVGVAINEAVEIAKKYGGEDSASFINGILGKLAREKTAEEQKPDGSGECGNNGE